MAQTGPLVILDGVDVDIDGCTVLHDIRFEIASGQHWGIVGANGSGKSTLLSLLSGQRWPRPGHGSRTYDFGDGPERDAVTARQRVALVGHELQDLYVARRWNFRALDIVHSGLTRTDIPQRRASPRSRQEAQALLESMDLGHLAERRLLELSRGEQRRVLIVRSLAFKPALLLLDEPASGLDTASRSDLDAMLTVAAARTQLVMTTHQVEKLPAFVTDRAIIESGRLRRLKPVDAETETETETETEIQPEPEPASRTQARPAVDSSAVPGADEREAPVRVLIRLEAASAWQGDRLILNTLNWTLNYGENWLITGQNGAGKSTLLRMLHAEIRPARGGKITWPGLGDPKDVWALRRSIALVSPELQARYRYPTRVVDAVASGFHSSIGLVQALTNAQNDRVLALLDDFELTAFGDRLLSTLSYGQRHRTLIARTLATDPQILLLDEPWEGLDTRSSDIVAEQIGRRMSAGTQVVCVSHVGPRGLCLNRRMTLKDGRIADVGGSVEPRESCASAQSRATNFRLR
jgi:molybdate transport system ATP-binding protein